MIGNERGIALVITLLVVSLLSIIVVEFTYSVEIDNHMARNALNGLQASLLARSGVNLGEAFLLHDDDPAVDAYTEDWGKVEDLNSQLIVPENMRLRVRIIDESGKFNINLTRPRDKNQWIQLRKTQDGDPKTRPQPLQSWRDTFERLLQSRGVDPQAATALWDYWDRLFDAAYPGQAPTGQGPAGQAAAGQPPGTPTPSLPQAANPTPNPQLLAWDFPSLDDASVIPGLTATAIRRLRPVLTALPYNQQQRVNANTAPVEVLRAILDDDGAVDNIGSLRRDAALRQQDLAPILSGLTQPGGTRSFANSMLGVTSTFFLVRASALVNPNPMTGRGGIGRSASMLVRRDRRTAPANAPTTSLRWTLTQLDWQKEGGAALFVQKSDEESGTEGLPPSDFPGTGG